MGVVLRQYIMPHILQRHREQQYVPSSSLVHVMFCFMFFFKLVSIIALVKSHRRVLKIMKTMKPSLMQSTVSADLVCTFYFKVNTIYKPLIFYSSNATTLWIIYIVEKGPIMWFFFFQERVVVYLRSSYKASCPTPQRSTSSIMVHSHFLLAMRLWSGLFLKIQWPSLKRRWNHYTTPWQ